MAKLEPLSFERLVNWIEGRLSREETAVITSQIAQADEDTKETIEWIRKFHHVHEKVAFVAPPSEMHTVLQQRFEQYAQGRRPLTLFQRLVATLTFDSHQQLGLVGARGTARQAFPRQHIYSTELADIALNFERTADESNSNPSLDKITVSGQIFPISQETNLTEFTIQLLQNATEIGLATADALGEFIFTAVPVGVYDIIVSHDVAEIEINAIDLIN